MITFNKIENKDIFKNGFKDFTKNNTLCFNDKRIIVIYGPNGTGKTSLINALEGNKDTDIKFNYENIEYDSNSCKDLIYIIKEQYYRNIINGEAKDFLLGDNILKEDELFKSLENNFNSFIKVEYKKILENDFLISSSKSKLIDIIKIEQIKDIIKIVAKKTLSFDLNLIVKLITIPKEIQVQNIKKYEEEKYKFFIKDYSKNNDSLIIKILDLKNRNIEKCSEVNEIEENDAALIVLNKYKDKDQCIVCDNTEYNSEILIQKKSDNKERIINLLDEETKKVMNEIIKLIGIEDPFNFKKIILKAIEEGDENLINDLKKELFIYIDIFNNNLIEKFKIIILKSKLLDIYSQYINLINMKIDIDDEDISYIQKIIENDMNKNLKVVRDKNKNIKIYLDEIDFLNLKREELPLSCAELNYLSLSFEFLRAKKSQNKFIVIDDPISSYDSIYKNKATFIIIDMLKDKKCLILTHNLDLVRLLNAQYLDCFHFYIMNNTEGEENGFIELKRKERNILTNITDLIQTFREDIFNYLNIENSKLYFISMIQYMRGYALITNNTNKEVLTKLMHGYGDNIEMDKKYNLKEIYYNLFQPYSYKFNSLKDCLISKKDILNLGNELNNSLNIIDVNDYYLLNKTLRHSLTYLHLRLLVENVLVQKYNINTDKYNKLGSIVNQAFIDDRKKRFQLTSKKTLLNEFNHFEGNFSIFQPAIDITDAGLSHEKQQILDFIYSL